MGGVSWSDFAIHNKVGEGQAGTVWCCSLLRPALGLPEGSRVAIKRYKTWLFEQHGQMERIVRELEVGRRCRHPNMVEMLGIVAEPDGRPALVMSYHDGHTLEHELNARRGADALFDSATSISILKGLAEAVVSLHNQGATHRDVKPANILVSAGSPILMDLGVVGTEALPEQTTSATFLGTIRYSAPEYLFGEPYSPNIDVYSIGAIAYELFSGAPFRGEDGHWARLIRSAGAPQVFDFRSYASRQGHQTAELVRFILSSTLCNARERISSRQLADSLNVTLLSRPFHVADGVATEGEPLVSHRGRIARPLAEVVAEVTSDLSTEAMERLRGHRRFAYWPNGHKYLWADQSTASTDQELFKRGLTSRVSAEGGDAWSELSEILSYALRYGYFD